MFYDKAQALSQFYTSYTQFKRRKSDTGFGNPCLLPSNPFFWAEEHRADKTDLDHEIGIFGEVKPYSKQLA